MKLTNDQTTSLAEGIKGTKLDYQLNHESWRSCNSCGHHFDARKDGHIFCPKCNSTDLRFGKF